MMKSFLPFLVLSCLVLSGCEETDPGMVVGAGIDALKAVTLDDEDVNRIAVEVTKQSDMKQKVASPDNPHSRRLQKLIKAYSEIDGYKFDYKVYLSPEINAF